MNRVSHGALKSAFSLSPSEEERVGVRSPFVIFGRGRLRAALCAWVLMLAIYQLAETTADPDLWGHVVFGQQMLKAGAIERTEMYSWTAYGQPFINHEYGADLILGGAHLLLGGTGILLLKLCIGLLTFTLALRLGAKGLSWPASGVAWIVGAVSIVEISFGFAARPQIFTALCLVLLLMFVRRIHEGARGWALAIPPLFVLWINIHGGALAGVGLLLLAAGSTTLEFLWTRYRAYPDTAPGPRAFLGSQQPEIGEDGQNCSWPPLHSDALRVRTIQERPDPSGCRDGSRSGHSRDLRTVLALWLASLGVIAALFCNPWGPALLRWLVKSVLWFRPEIEEWNPAPFGWDHAALFILIAASAFAWAASRRRRALWELAVCGAFALLALRSVRNAPLFCLIALALVPPHLADALNRFQNHFARFIQAGRQPAVQKLATALLAFSAAAIALGTFTLHKDHPFTMEVPRARYPVAAVDFIRAHELRGKLLVFFDWGDLAIFHLPDCPVSIDGRLDACYSRALIAAHWKLYNGEDVDQTVLPIAQADLALLPSNLAGTLALSKQPGWQIVYFDETAAVLARNPQRFPRLTGLQLPVQGGKEAALGRAPFPDLNPR